MCPFNAFQFIQGLETLPLRMREHCRNASAVALISQRIPRSRASSIPGMHEDAEQRRRADTYLKGGYGGLVGFELKGGREAGRALHRRAQDVLSRRQYRRCALARHPSGQHHAFAAERRTSSCATGVTPGYVRLSVGIEHIDDILADLDQALAQA